MANKDTIDLTLTGPRISVPTNLSKEPQETRSGYSERDKSPFYEMSEKKLYGYYYGYNTSYEFRHSMLYADLVSLKIGEMHPVTSNSIKTENILVRLEAVPFRLPNKLIDHHAKAIEFFKKLKKLNQNANSGVWENNTTIRLSKISSTPILTEFLCQTVTYFDQVGTNITLDWNSGALKNNGPTIRAVIEKPIEGKLRSLADSSLANNFGTAVMFYDKSLKKTFVRVRSDAMGSISQRGLHCTVSGVLELEPNTKPGSYDFEFFLYGTHLEIKMETDLDKDQYLLFPVAFARELPRGGKPQLFFVAVLLVEDNEFEIACQNAEERNEYIPNADQTFFGESELSIKEAFTYEGYACHILAEDFIKANEDKIREIVAAAPSPG